MLGLPTASQVSRLEHAVREPSLRTLLALELLFHAPVRRLFAGVQDEVERKTTGRARRLHARLTRASASPRLERKRETLRTLMESHGDVLDLPV